MSSYTVIHAMMYISQYPSVQRSCLPPSCVMDNLWLHIGHFLSLAEVCEVKCDNLWQTSATTSPPIFPFSLTHCHSTSRHKSQARSVLSDGHVILVVFTWRSPLASLTPLDIYIHFFRSSSFFSLYLEERKVVHFTRRAYCEVCTDGFRKRRLNGKGKVRVRLWVDILRYKLGGFKSIQLNTS